jgi:rare lipoprotein A (peptidoglycan hydrolase)
MVNYPEGTRRTVSCATRSNDAGTASAAYSDTPIQNLEKSNVGPHVFSGKAPFFSYRTGKTASGSAFDRNLPTAAPRSLPFGTKVRVTVPATSKSVVVCVTDRGPHIRDRVLDLSLGAARNLGITDEGVAEIRAALTFDEARAELFAQKPRLGYLQVISAPQPFPR